jgi:hypothetical protein
LHPQNLVPTNRRFGNSFVVVLIKTYKNMSSTKRQSNLASFFGGAAAKKAPLKSKKQDFLKSKSSSSSLSSSTPSKTKQEKAAKKDDGGSDGSLTPISPLPKSKARTKKGKTVNPIPETKEEDTLMDTDDEDEETIIGKKDKSTSSPNENGGGGGGGGARKKRRVIVDDSSEDEMEDSDEMDVEKAKEEDMMKEEQQSTDDDNKGEEEEEGEDFKEADEPSDDDDDEEEEEFEEESEAIKEDDSEEEEEDEEEELDVKVSSLSKKSSKTATKPKKNALSALKAPSSTSTKKSKTTKKKSTTALQSIPSDDEIKSKLDTIHKQKWQLDKNGTRTPMPYSILCQTLSEIEAISSRLEIQRYLTNLFRLCLLSNPMDLITLLYLSSNTVAAAYECVELGIGDAILIKAVGEACGSNPSMVKQRYEADGDLGTVAQHAKGKQRTLGFGMKPKPLAAEDVLSVFRQIAMTSGAQSQKFKVNMIKGLLNRAQKEGTESKYIVRGLQGKLRIGLAQSTVLISLAHAILLSKSQEEQETDKAKEEEEESDKPLSQNSINVANTKLPLESRLEAAVNVVKKAYSEVPSFDALSDALLSVPLSRLHESCTLRPGLPVEPMLAKPTKSVQEVLKRLNGKRFTCEFKYDGERAQVHMKQDGVTKVRIWCWGPFLSHCLNYFITQLSPFIEGFLPIFIRYI